MWDMLLHTTAWVGSAWCLQRAVWLDGLSSRYQGRGASELNGKHISVPHRCINLQWRGGRQADKQKNSCLRKLIGKGGLRGKTKKKSSCRKAARVVANYTLRIQQPRRNSRLDIVSCCICNRGGGGEEERDARTWKEIKYNVFRLFKNIFS